MRYNFKVDKLIISVKIVRNSKDFKFVNNSIILTILSFWYKNCKEKNFFQLTLFNIKYLHELKPAFIFATSTMTKQIQIKKQKHES